MKVTRVYTDNKGETHFEDTDVKLENFENIFRRSAPLKATDMSFSAFNNATAESWHTAPRKQAVIILNGEVELQVSDGSKRKFGQSHVIFLEDTTGKGHTTHSVDGKPREEVWVGIT